MTTLITGINGFAAGWLAESLLESGESLCGTVYGSQCSVVSDSADCIDLDLRNFESTRDLIGKIKPDKIYHLAGWASVGMSFANPKPVYDVNLVGTIHLLEAVRLLDRPAKILLVSSAEVYGKVPPEKMPPAEDCPLAPESPYAGSKAAAELAARTYRLGSGGQLEIVTVRPFNHTGPRQAENFVCPDFCKRIAAAAEGSSIKVGNLDAERDFSDVRDIVRGYRLAMEQGQDGAAYNLASGKTISIAGLLQKLIEISGKNVTSTPDPKLYRVNDVPIFFGNPAKAEAELGWRTEIELDRTLADCYEYYSAAGGSQNGG